MTFTMHSPYQKMHMKLIEQEYKLKPREQLKQPKKKLKAVVAPIPEVQVEADPILGVQEGVHHTLITMIEAPLLEALVHQYGKGRESQVHHQTKELDQKERSDCWFASLMPNINEAL